jgi:hypothetical protein
MPVIVNEFGQVVMRRIDYAVEVCAAGGRKNYWVYEPDRWHMWSLIGYRSTKQTYSERVMDRLNRDALLTE